MEKIHLLITLRGPVWRVRILIPGEPRLLWRAYRAADYPTPEAVTRRCIAGLALRGKDEGHDDHNAEREQDVSQYDGPLRVRWECWGWLVGEKEFRRHTAKVKSR